MSGNRISELLAHMASEQDALASQPMPSLADKVMRAAWSDLMPPLLPVAMGSPHPRRRLLPIVGLSAAFGFASVAVLLLVLRPGKPLIAASVGRDPVPVTMGASLVASQDAPLPLHFSDGSRITFRPSARASVAKVTKAGAEMVLESGDILAQIQHLPGAAWQVTAGPFRVVVTGTRFLASYLPEEKALTVRLYEGSVIVQGPALGNGMALVAGQMLEVRAGKPFTVRQLAVESAMSLEIPKVVVEPIPPTPSAAVEEPTVELVERPTASDPREKNSEWIGLAERGRYEAAFTAAERLGFSDLCRHLPARRLLSLGDVARFTGDYLRTREAYEAIVRRFPKDRHTSDAMFGLGRLSSEGGKSAEAAAWFERYLVAWPNDSLAEQATGRLLELYPALGDGESAARIAQRYLDRYPSGMRRSLAQRILAGRGAEARR